MGEKNKLRKEYCSQSHESRNSPLMWFSINWPICSPSHCTFFSITKLNLVHHMPSSNCLYTSKLLSIIISISVPQCLNEPCVFSSVSLEIYEGKKGKCIKRKVTPQIDNNNLVCDGNNIHFMIDSLTLRMTNKLWIQFTQKNTLIGIGRRKKVETTNCWQYNCGVWTERLNISFALFLLAMCPIRWQIDRILLFNLHWRKIVLQRNQSIDLVVSKMKIGGYNSIDSQRFKNEFENCLSRENRFDRERARKKKQCRRIFAFDSRFSAWCVPPTIVSSTTTHREWSPQRISMESLI